MRKFALTALVVLGFLLCAGNKVNAVALVDFATDLDGFVSDPFDNGTTPPITYQGTAGSGGPIGWAGTTIDTSSVTVNGPFVGMNKGTNAAFAGDWVTNYGGGGTVLTYSMDFMLDTAMATFDGFTARTITGVSDWKYNNLGGGAVAAGVWNTASVTFDTAWTDAQALTAGWLQVQTGTFATTFANVGHFEFKYTRVMPVSGATQLPNGAVIGVDNLNITPEPASLALLGLGGLMLVRRRTQR